MGYSCFGSGMACHTLSFRTVTLHLSVVSTSFFYNRVRSGPLLLFLVASDLEKTASVPYRGLGVGRGGSLLSARLQLNGTFLQVAVRTLRPRVLPGNRTRALNPLPLILSTLSTSGVFVLVSSLRVGIVSMSITSVLILLTQPRVNPCAQGPTTSGPGEGKSS